LKDYGNEAATVARTAHDALEVKARADAPATGV
jgi:hypothetical protein